MQQVNYITIFDPGVEQKNMLSGVSLAILFLTSTILTWVTEVLCFISEKGLLPHVTTYSDVPSSEVANFPVESNVALAH